MPTVAFIFARGGSKGVPRKNIRPLAGKPLIAYAIETARQSKRIDRVVVSTDDQEIAAVAREFGAEVPFLRPAELATDDAPEWLSWQHALQELGPEACEIFVSVPVTSPLRAVEDLDAAVEKLDAGTDAVISVSAAERNPYFNMVRIDDHGYARIVIEDPGQPTRRQSAPVVYDMTTVVYAARAEFIRRNARLFAGRVKAVIVPRERALDIDTHLDFELAEFLMLRRQRLAPTPAR